MLQCYVGNPEQIARGDLGMHIHKVTHGYLTLGYLLIHAFLHLQMLQPLCHVVLFVKMKAVFLCGFGTHRLVFNYEFKWLTLYVTQK